MGDYFADFQLSGSVVWISPRVVDPSDAMILDLVSDDVFGRAEVRCERSFPSCSTVWTWAPFTPSRSRSPRARS
jgi:hypothetical protein